MLDDLQWAGPDAFDLLRTVIPPAGSPGVRIVGAYRDSEPSSDAGLQEFVADLAREFAGPGPWVGAPRRRCRGAARHRTDAGRDRNRGGGTRDRAARRRRSVFPHQLPGESPTGEAVEPELSLPWTVAQVIRQRVVALPETARELLGVAAAVGRVMSLSLLVRITNRSDEEVLEALETAVDARLLAEDARSGYHFAHDLIRETIEAGLSVGRRQLLHRRIGETLEGDPGSSAEVLAFHFTLGDDDARAIDYLEQAGEQAQQRVAHSLRGRLLPAGYRPARGMGRSEDTLPIYERLGSALYRSAHNDEAIAL